MQINDIQESSLFSSTQLSFISTQIFQKINDKNNYGYFDLELSLSEHSPQFIILLRKYLNKKGFKTIFNMDEEKAYIFIFWDKLTRKYLYTSNIINYSTSIKILHKVLEQGILINEKPILPNFFALRLSRYDISDLCIFSVLDKTNNYAILHPLYFDNDNNIRINTLDNMITLKYSNNKDELIKTINLYNDIQLADKEDKNIFDKLVLITI